MKGKGELQAGRVPLDCSIYPGMFSTERRVVITVGDDTYVTYVAEELLTITAEPDPEGGVKGKVWVKIRQDLPNAFVVALPEETISTGELITVPKDMVGALTD